MSRPLDVGLEVLTKMLLKMGEAAKEAVSLSIDGFLNMVDVSERVRSLSELVFLMGQELEDKAVELIIRYQPMASDLRLLKSYMKIAYDFERYCRYAWDISFTHKKLMTSIILERPPASLEEMAKKVVKMVYLSVEALKRRDVEMAKSLAIMEDDVDNMYMGQLNALTEELPAVTKCMVSNLLVARHLERIADHAAYVGESLVYMITGERVILR